MFLIMRGGQSGTLTFFFKSVAYRPTLSKFRGGQLKKTHCTFFNLKRFFFCFDELTNINITVYVPLIRLNLKKCARILRNYLELKYYSDKLI